jgi:hypothetical protein
VGEIGQFFFSKGALIKDFGEIHTGEMRLGFRRNPFRRNPFSLPDPYFSNSKPPTSTPFPSIFFLEIPALQTILTPDIYANSLPLHKKIA